MTVVVALGDSLTCGEGVGVRVAPDATWVALLAAAIPGGRLVPLARPGARIRDVRLRQLPQATPSKLTTVIAGLNDVARTGFDAEEIRVDLVETIRQLVSQGSEVLLGRLHNPAKMLPMPSRISDIVRTRIDSVNAAVDAAATYPFVHVIDLAELPALQQPGGWSTDRIHPSRVGHQAIAAAAARAFPHADRRLTTLLPEPSVPAGPSAGARGWWAIRHGMPYAARHVGDFGPPVLSALARRA